MGTRALIALAIVLPWLALVPMANAAIAVALFTCALAASFHGWGLLVARGPATAAMQAGIAVCIGLSGVALALGIYTTTTATLVLFGGVAIHSVRLGRRLGASWFGAGAFTRPSPWLIAPLVVLAILGTVVVLGSAGDLASRPFDDDGNLLDQLRRIADTGSLGDVLGYPRAYQLGGHAALAAFANVAGDARWLRVIDGLGFVLAMGFVLVRMRLRDAHGALWATLIVIAGSALALAVSDPLPVWLGIGMMLALLEEDTPPLAAGVLAGALVALRHAYAPFAIVALVRVVRGDRRRALTGSVAALVVVLPYLVAALRAAHGIPVGALAIASPSGLPAKLGIAAAIALALLPLFAVALRDVRGLAFAAAAGLAGIAAQLTGDHALRFAWAIGIACMLALAITYAREPRTAAPTALLAALVLCVFIYEGETASGRASWYRRTSDLLDGIGYLARTHVSPPRDLDGILDAVPGDALVALWVPEPGRIDHARHRVVDLRTPRVAARADRALSMLHPRYLLLAPEDPPKLLNRLPPPIASRDGLILVELR